MSLFSNIKNALKVNNGLPVPIKSGTRIVDGDTGDDYVFDGKHWNRIVLNTSTRSVDKVSNMFLRGLDISSNSTSSPRRMISSSNNDSVTFIAADNLSGFDSSCYSSSDSSSSCDSGGSGGSD